MCGSGPGGNRAAKRGGIHTQQRPRCHSPGLNPTTRRRGCEKSSRPRTPHTRPPAHTPKFGTRTWGRCPRARRETHAREGRGHRQRPGPPKPHPALTCILAANPLRKRTFTGTTALIYGSPPPSGKGAEPAHDTTFPVYPAPPPPGTSSISVPSPTSRGPWSMYAQPTDELWAARACSSRSRGGRERVGGGRERALPRFQGSGSLSTVPGLPPGRGESSFCMNYSPHSWGVGRRGGGRVRTSRSFPLYHSHFNCKDRDWGVPLPRPQPCRLAGSGPTPRAAGCTGAGASPAPALPAPSDWREV